MNGTSFVPKQARLKDAKLYGELISRFTQSIAEKALDFLPQLTDGAVVLDNGCGIGEVTRAIMARSPKEIKIKANDIDQQYIEAYTAQAKAQDWHCEAFNMPSESLQFEADTFDLAFANFVVFLTAEDGVPAMREIHRTLKPRGTAVHTSWSQFPVMPAIQQANLASRGPNAKPLRDHPPEWASETWLKDIAIKAGFEESNVHCRAVPQIVHIGKLKDFAEMSWSWLGCPETGWAKEDEEHWDEAVDAFLEECRSSGLYTESDEGDDSMECTAYVVWATK